MAQPAGAQQLSNPGFEPPYEIVESIDCGALRGAVARGWRDNSCWDGNTDVQLEYASDASGPHGGRGCQTFEVGRGRAQLGQLTTLNDGDVYSASVWLRSPQEVTVTLSLRQASSPYVAYPSRTFALSSVWQRFEIAGVPTARRSYFMIESGGPARIWVDDARLDATPYRQPLPDAPVDPAFFGMHFHRSNVTWPVDQTIGAVRIWDAWGKGGLAQWAEAHKGPKSYDWRAIDQHVLRATREGADVLFVLGRTPRWASKRPDESSAYGPGEAAEPRDMALWREWVTAVGSRYAGKIRYWEVWNEPNDERFFSGTVEDLVALTAEAYAILKHLDPANQIVSPSAYETSYLERFLEAGGTECVDIVGYHFYTIGRQPEVLYTSDIPRVRTMLRQVGASDKPLWNTEAGWYAPPRLADDVGVAQLARSYLLNWARGIERFYFYSWDGDEETGVALAEVPSFRVATAAGLAFRELSGWLVGSRMTAVEVGSPWWVELRRANGSRAFVVWEPSGSQRSRFRVPEDWEISHVRDLSGAVTRLVADDTGARQVWIDGRPQLFELQLLPTER